ncbi:MAG: hypothetical protein JXQ72_05345 [Anaerolineae bacterium]|nr:hypothetical protein [Anaerolineae bacterium]
MRRYFLPFTTFLLIGMLLAPGMPVRSVRAQGPYPLPADLFILTSEHRLIQIDAASGAQTDLLSPDQFVIDFDVSPDGEWLVYRTDTNMVIVSQIGTGSGYVLEFFDVAPLPADPDQQTIVWSPDASAIAYLTYQGARIAELGAGEYGEAVFSDIPGQWRDLFWADTHTLVASDESGATSKITPSVSGQHGLFSVEAAPDAILLQPTSFAPVALSPQGVQLADQQIVPGTAGSLAVSWGALPPPEMATTGAAATTVLPASLTYLAPDVAGVDQLWQLAAGTQPVRALTAEAVPVLAYAVAQNGTVAYVAGNELITAAPDGSNRCVLAALTLESMIPSLDWHPGGFQIAYADQQGVWLVESDGSTGPRLLVRNSIGTDPGTFRVYLNPRWSLDGSRLLLTMGLYEGSGLVLADTFTGAITELPNAYTGQGRWTGDGRVLVWGASQGGYGVAGLYLIDPATPDAAPTALLDSTVPVVDVVPGANGSWFALVASTANMGPQFVRVWRADSLEGPFAPMYELPDAGGFASQARLTPPGPGQSALAAGLRGMTWSGQSIASGDLVIVNLQSGAAVQVQTSGPAHDVRWQ